jgi:uridylate kinase
MAARTYQRVMLKLSGEALMGDTQYGHDLETVRGICQEIKAVHDKGIEICLVVGGGNIFRGMNAADAGMERSSADYMGMLATVMNALALQNCLEKEGMDTRVLSAITMNSVCEPYVRRRAIRHMERGRIIICAAGTGNPFFTTDTASALRAIELDCDVLLKGTQVDGVYDKDPKKHDDAVRFEELTYKKVLADDLNVMDGAAIALAKENNLPIAVFAIRKKNAFSDVVAGKGVFTLIKNKF